MIAQTKRLKNALKEVGAIHGWLDKPPSVRTAKDERGEWEDARSSVRFPIASLEAVKAHKDIHMCEKWTVEKGMVRVSVSSSREVAERQASFQRFLQRLR